MAKRNDQQKKYTFETFEKTQITNILLYPGNDPSKAFNPADSLPVDFLCW